MGIAEKSCVVFKRNEDKSDDRLQTADGRGEASILSVSPHGIAEEMYGAIKNEQIINKRDNGKEKNDVFGSRQDYRTSRVSEVPRGKKRIAKNGNFRSPGLWRSADIK